MIKNPEIPLDDAETDTDEDTATETDEDTASLDEQESS